MITGTTILAAGQALVVTGGAKDVNTGFTGAVNGTGVLTLGVSRQDAYDYMGTYDVVYDEEGIKEYPGANFTVPGYVFRGADGFPTQTLGDVDNYTLLGIAIAPTTVYLILPQLGVPRAGAQQRPMSIGDNQPIPHQTTDAERPLHKDFYGLGGASAVQPTAHREVTAQYVDNTHLALKMMGDDGVVRSVVLVLA